MQRNPLILCLLLLTACSGFNFSMPRGIVPAATPSQSNEQISTPISIPSNAPSPVAIPTLAAKPSTTAPISVLPYYILTVNLDFISHRLVVKETISYQNATGQTLTNIMLAVEPNLWAGCFTLDSLAMGGQDVIVKLIGDQLDVHLTSPLMPDQTAYLELHFSLNLPWMDSQHVFGYNTLQSNLVDWYPFIVPYSGGWVLHPIGNVGEHLVYAPSNYDVSVTLTDATLPVRIAASVPAETSGGLWHYLLNDARTFVFSASVGLHSITSTVDGITITSTFFPEDQTQGQAVLGEVSKAVTTFSTLFGPLPNSSLSIVETPFFDGLESEGLFFLSRDFYKEDDGTVLNNMIDIAIHETAHQWWFGSVGNDQAMEPWLDEAMATYSEQLFYEKNYPGVNAWWAFRVDVYSPSGWVDTDIYHGGNFRTYANAVYLRGAQFLEELRMRVGDDDFFAFLKDYAGQMAGKNATADDFFRILRQHTNKDYSDLLRTYFQYQH